MSKPSANKPRAYYLNTHVMVLSEADAPEPHAHLATQLTISLNGPARWEIEGRGLTAPAVYIDGGVKHHCLSAGDHLTFLFVKTGNYAFDAQQRLLRGQPYAALNDGISLSTKEHVRQHADNPQALSAKVLRSCNFSDKATPCFDSRIRTALDTLEGMDVIPADAPALLCDEACLSQSRFSHLFKQETGMTLASYLAFQKLRKTYQGLLSGKNITQAAMDAGFSSPSHCAASCTRMFGVSLRNISPQ